MLKKVITLILVIFISGSTIISNSIVLFASELTSNYSESSHYSIISYPYFEYKYDTTCVYVYDKTSIPVSFEIVGLQSNQICSLRVESDSVKLTTDSGTIHYYSMYDNDVNIEIRYKSDNTVKLTNDIIVDEIRVIANGLTEEIYPCTLTLYVINSVNGVFVSYIGKEEVTDYYYEWLDDNNMISHIDFVRYIENKTKSVTVDENVFLKAMNSKAIRSNQDTSIYMNYSIQGVNSGAMLNISGNIAWTDTNGLAHAARSIKVHILDHDDTLDEVLAVIYTDDNGNFSSTITNQLGSNESGSDIFFRVYVESSNISVRSSSNVTYSFTTPIMQNVTGNVSTQYQTVSPSNLTRAFYIHQAGIVGSRYVTSMSGNSPSNCVYRYPYSDSQSNKFTGVYIQITSSHYSVWDAILHEYGHFIASIYSISNSPGGQHSFYENLIDKFCGEEYNYTLYEAKSRGCRLAWSEGWADYFSIASQMQQNVSTLIIPNAGDTSYNNPVKGINQWIERVIIKSGEGDELAIAAVLWDLTDATGIDGGISEPFDMISFGYGEVWEYCVDSGATIFSTFISYVYSNVNTSSYISMGGILGEYNFTIQNLKTNGSTSYNYYFTNDTPPVLNWIQPSGSSECGNTYTLCIYSTSLNLIQTISISSNTTSYTITNSLWNQLKSNYTSGFYWCVKVTPMSSPSTGPYYSRFVRCYLTNIL